jgi:hypothetical protein
MQTKLVIATLAAMSDLTSAVTTSTSSSLGEASAAATLISYYEDCHVAINNI